MLMDVNEIQKIIPHRYPFLLLDRVTDLVAKEFIVGYKNVTIGDHIFQGHFPGHPIYPGVMILEGMAQAGAILAFKSIGDMTKEEAAEKVVYFMSIDKAKFRNPVIPDCELNLDIEAVRSHGRVWKYKGIANVNGKKMADAQWSATIVDRK